MVHIQVLRLHIMQYANNKPDRIKKCSLNMTNHVQVPLQLFCIQPFLVLENIYQINMTNHFYSLKDKHTYIYCKYMQWICNINFNPF